MKTTKCKNCNHAIRSTTIWDSPRLRENPNAPYIHRKHDIDGNCQVIWCKCQRAEPKEEFDCNLDNPKVNHIGGV